MTNEEYVIENLTESKHLINVLCPKDLSEMLIELDECTGDCDECWELEVKI